MDTEDVDKYVLDVTNTLVSNIACVAFMLLIGVFMIIGLNFIGTMESEEAQVLGLLVWMFSTVRLMGWMRLPNLEYKPRVRLVRFPEPPTIEKKGE